MTEDDDDDDDDYDNNKKNELGLDADCKKTTKKGLKIRPLPRRWPPSQTITTTSWHFSKPSRSSHHKSPRHHSIFARTSMNISGSIGGQTPTFPRHPSWSHKTTQVSRAS